jgi:hypothetical protein
MHEQQLIKARQPVLELRAQLLAGSSSTRLLPVVSEIAVANCLYVPAC